MKNTLKDMQQIHRGRNEHCYELMNDGVWIKVLTTFVSPPFFKLFDVRLGVRWELYTMDESERTNWHIDL